MLALRTPSPEEFLLIRNFIEEFELDDRNLKQEEFTAAFRDNELVGFGRLREHSDCTELCSLGVVTPYRRKGIGKAVVNHLISRSKTPVHLVCIIPSFFTPFGFSIIEDFPDSMQHKLDYCRKELSVPEPYVAMLFNK